ncbi:MAG: rhomboid family intramembrane serine protease [Thermoanaerobaculia bacterium]
MFKSRENIHVIYILLFLEAAFFVLQTQDPERYARFFAFVPDRFFAGEIWRLLTYQFIQSGLLGFFFSLLILYIMGNALEDQWGSADFVTFWALSIVGSAAVAVFLGSPLIGSFFLTYSLLFAYAATYPEMTFLIFFVLPVKVKWLAWIALAFLAFGVVRMQPASLAAAGGALVSMAYFWLRHGRYARGRVPRPKVVVSQRPPIDAGDETRADRNLALFDRVEKTVATGTPEERERLRSEIEKTIVPGVNICPPPDYKPRAEDRYCIRCEGFSECTARFIRLAEEKDERRAAEK